MEEKKLKIGIDIDEVVVETIKPFLNFFNNERKTNFKFEDFKSYNWWEILPITKEEAFSLSDFFFESHFEDIPFVEGAKEFIEKISESLEIVFITSRREKIKQKTRDFLKDNFFGLGYSLFFSSEWDKESEKDKGDICVGEGIGILVEDNGEHSLNYAERGIKVLLFDKPWNQKIEHENIIRVYSWKEIYEEIIKIKNGINTKN